MNLLLRKFGSNLFLFGFLTWYLLFQKNMIEILYNFIFFWKKQQVGDKILTLWWGAYLTLVQILAYVLDTCLCWYILLRERERNYLNCTGVFFYNLFLYLNLGNIWFMNNRGDRGEWVTITSSKLQNL